MGKKTALIDKSKKGAEKNTLMYIAICSLNNNLIYIFDGLIICNVEFENSNISFYFNIKNLSKNLFTDK